MNEDIHILAVGLAYLILAVPIWYRNRLNKFDKGYQWILFSVAHGLDEIFDYFAGYKGVDFIENNHILFEKLELVAFFLTATYLLLAGLVKLELIRSNQTLSQGLFLPMIVVIFILGFNELVLDAIGDLSITLYGLEYSYVTIIFGFVSAIPLIYAYFYEFAVLFSKTVKLRNFNSKQVWFSLSNGILFILYIIGEVYASYWILLVYLEVLAIFFVMLSPLEVILESNIQLFLIYDKDGLPVFHTKFNTRIDDDLIVLVTGFLTAINSMATQELKMGNLDTIQTDNGLLISDYSTKYIFSILVNEDRIKTRETFEQVIHALEDMLPDHYEGIIQNSKQLEQKILSSFIS